MTGSTDRLDCKCERTLVVVKIITHSTFLAVVGIPLKRQVVQNGVLSIHGVLMICCDFFLIL